MSIAENLMKVRERMASAAAKTGRDPRDITLIAVTKTVDVSLIEEAVKAGVTDIGENYIQDAVAKYEGVGAAVRWHMIGHLQSNKVKNAVPIFDTIQTVDSLSLAREIGKRSGAIGKISEVLVEVNISDEISKFGAKSEGALGLCAEVSDVEGLSLVGLMGIAPFVDDSSVVGRSFAALRSMWEKLPLAHRKWLSMGMSGDFEIAIEEGSNMVRVGTAIFGPRVKPSVL